METAADRAASGVRALIASGRYRPGDRLPAERELAQQLELSRPALREGIRRLRSGGVLESRRGSGTYVALIDLEGVFDVRLKLEPLAAERAALNRSARDAAELGRIIARMRGQLSSVEAFAASDAKIHALVARASGNPVLSGMLARLSELTSMSRSFTAPSTPVRTSTLMEMERIVAAVERRHPRRAANAMERHLLTVRTEFSSATRTNRRGAAAMTASTRT